MDFAFGACVTWNRSLVAGDYIYIHLAKVYVELRCLLVFSGIFIFRSFSVFCLLDRIFFFEAVDAGMSRFILG